MDLMRTGLVIVLFLLGAGCDRPGTTLALDARDRTTPPPETATRAVGEDVGGRQRDAYAPSASARAGGTATGVTRTSQAGTAAVDEDAPLPDEPCLGLRDQALDACLTRDIEAQLQDSQKASDPALREFEQAQRERDRQLLEEE